MCIRPIPLAALCHIAVVLGLSAQAATARAQHLRPGIIGADDRVIVRETGAPWDAVGQINVRGYRRTKRCTGTLVTPNVVVTSAHCLVDPWARRPYPARNIHFLAGVRRGSHKGHATAACVKVPRQFLAVAPDKVLPALPAQSQSIKAFAADLGVLILKHRLAVAPVPLIPDGQELPEDQSFVYPAYTAKRRYMLSAHFGCRRLERVAKHDLWLTTCDTHMAGSGGPLLVKARSGYAISAVVSGAIPRLASIAVPIARWRALIAQARCP